MDKNSIKKYAVWARRELIERVSKRALKYGINPKEAADPNDDSLDGYLFSNIEKRQRQILIGKINEKGYQQVMEEVAYTWFNRFVALRFMEVNHYLPSHIRVFTNDNNEFKPQILDEAIHLELEGLDKAKVYELEKENRKEDLFKYLVIIQCNALNTIFPRIFQKINDYTELLFPDFLLREGSAIEQMVLCIKEEDWKDQVQIIGWLYQYYNTEPKDKVFGDLKKNIKITKENIPAATQLFTPDWIVHYMVENSLGRLWLEGHPSDSLKTEWKYYLDEAEQEAEVNAQLDNIRKEYAKLKPEEIRVIDPCMGSGHILCVLFDVLVQIYKDYGYTEKEAVVNILEKNLYGLDIDERAAQLAYFAVMMKARYYDRRYFSHAVQPHVFRIKESNYVSAEVINYFCEGYREQDTGNKGNVNESSCQNRHCLSCKDEPSLDGVAIQKELDNMLLLNKVYSNSVSTPPQVGALEAIHHQSPTTSHAEASSSLFPLPSSLSPNNYDSSTKLKKAVDDLLLQTRDASEYGSLISITDIDFDILYNRIEEIMVDNSFLNLKNDVLEQVLPLIQVAQALSQKYDVVVTNPPYMGIGGMDKTLSNYVGVNYPNSKMDLFAVFIERCQKMLKKNGFQAIITQHSWMFLSSFETLRKSLYKIETINMVHLGAHAFEEISGEVVQTTSFVRINTKIDNYLGRYVRLVEPVTQKAKEELFFKKTTVFEANQKDFYKLPFSPCSYWVSKELLIAFEKAPKVSDLGEPKVGLQAGNSEKYFRYWFEVKFCNISFNKDLSYKWFPCVKGGESRKWFGNNIFVIDWSNDGYGIKHEKSAVIRNPSYYFREGLSWTKITSIFALRYFPKNMILSDSSVYIFPKDYKAMLGCLNSKVTPMIISLLNPTLNFVASTVGAIPILIDKTDKVSFLVEDSIFLSKSDWDSFETSWDFVRHPLVKLRGFASVNNPLSPSLPAPYTLKDAFSLWQQECSQRFDTLKSNEEQLNRIFIDIYGLNYELTPDVDDKDITVRKADLQREIRSFISYAVGCMMGRYSLDCDGIAYAGGEWDVSKYTTFKAESHGILPITDDEYFENDIVSRFIEFVKVVYGEDTLEENLKFIADSLGGKGNSRQVIRNYFINDFFADHVKVYQKRPIYWLFDSGKKNSFKCLLYMHRYEFDTMARIRTDFVHETQSRYRTAIAELERRICDISTSERVKLNKQLAKLRGQADELKVYEEKIHHFADMMIRIDFDEGIKHNYAIFADVLAKIK